MLKDIVRSAGRRAGVDIFRASTEPFRWSHTVHDYHPVVPSSRWAPGSPPHGQLRSVLARESAAYEAFLDALEGQADLLHSVPHESCVADPVRLLLPPRSTGGGALSSPRSREAGWAAPACPQVLCYAMRCDAMRCDAIL